MKRSCPRPQTLDFGLVAWLEQTRVALPLKGVECRFEIIGAISCVEMDQVYFQNADRAVDCTYTFPLPSGAAVYRCELHVNGRVIRAKVEEKEEAKRIYLKKKASGHRAGLVESVRENLFTLSLGNVQPGDLIVVRFAWFQMLDRNSDELRLLIPTCPGVKYIPGKLLLRSSSGRGTVNDTDQVPDASRITPPRIDSLNRDASYLSIDGKIFANDVETDTLSSPSHAITLRESVGLISTAIHGRNAVPDRDFVLTWREPKAKQLVPQAWSWTANNETFALVQLRAPEVVSRAEGFSQDFYFLVDRSGSMQGTKWEKSCEALHAFIRLLGEGDRVAITVFGSEFRDFAEKPMPAPMVLTDRGFLRMQSLGTAGGTELLPAMRHIVELSSLHSKNCRATVVLITDGQVGDEAEILNALKTAPQLIVHTFGIDTAVNDAFLKSLASQQRGGCWLQTPNDDIAGTVAALGDRLRRPVLTGLSIRGNWETSRENLPDLHAREVVSVAVRGHESADLEIGGLLPDGKEHQFTINLTVKGNEAIKLLWAKERISSLLAANRKVEAIKCAKGYNLVCEGAAFIAWDESEQIAIASDEVIQPALEPYWEQVAGNICAPMSVRPSMATRGGMRQLRYHDRLDGSEYMESTIARHYAALHQEKVLQATIENLVAWGRMEATGERMTVIDIVAEAIEVVRRELSNRVQPLILEQIFKRAIERPPATLVAWAEELLIPIKQLLDLRDLLAKEETPIAVFDQLVAWVIGDGIPKLERLEIIQQQADALRHLPFSAYSKAHCWREFLETNCRETPFARGVLQDWIIELEAKNEGVRKDA